MIEFRWIEKRTYLQVSQNRSARPKRGLHSDFKDHIKNMTWYRAGVGVYSRLLHLLEAMC